MIRYLIILLLAASFSCNSQSSITSSFFTSNELTYVIGQVFWMSSDNVTQGLLQPDVEKTFNTDSYAYSGYEIRAFPNPCIDYVQIKIRDAKYALYGFDGKLISQGIIDDKDTKIDTSYLEGGLYVLRVYWDGGKKSFKIIKN